MTAWTRRLPWFVAWFASQPSRAVRPSSPPAAAGTAANAEPRDNYPELEERRADALRRMFPKLHSWYANRSEWMVAVEVQKYLAQATNIADLENRIRVIEQRRHFGD